MKDAIVRVGDVSSRVIEDLLAFSQQAVWSHWNEGRDYHTWYCSGLEDIASEIGLLQPPYLQQFYLRIPPRGFVHRHVDRRKGQTYHIPLTSNEESWCYMHQNGATAGHQLEVGGLYWIDRSIEHSSVNNGDNDRIHVLIEI